MLQHSVAWCNTAQRAAIACVHLTAETNFDPRKFFHDRIKRQRPVVLKGIAKQWPAASKWLNDS
jgi:hypothetical protein